MWHGIACLCLDCWAWPLKAAEGHVIAIPVGHLAWMASMPELNAALLESNLIPVGFGIEAVHRSMKHDIRKEKEG